MYPAQVGLERATGQRLPTSGAGDFLSAEFLEAGALPGGASFACSSGLLKHEGLGEGCHGLGLVDVSDKTNPTEEADKNISGLLEPGVGCGGHQAVICLESGKMLGHSPAHALLGSRAVIINNKGEPMS